MPTRSEKIINVPRSVSQDTTGDTMGEREPTEVRSSGETSIPAATISEAERGLIKYCQKKFGKPAALLLSVCFLLVSFVAAVAITYVSKKY